MPASMNLARISAGVCGHLHPPPPQQSFAVGPGGWRGLLARMRAAWIQETEDDILEIWIVVLRCHSEDYDTSLSFVINALQIYVKYTQKKRSDVTPKPRRFSPQGEPLIEGPRPIWRPECPYGTLLRQQEADLP